jgi:Predicted RNA-binding protein
MLKSIEISSKTADEAVVKALAQLGLEREDVSVEIVERAKSGFLGIGASNAVVRVTYEAPDEDRPEPASVGNGDTGAPVYKPAAPANRPTAPKASKTERPAVPSNKPLASKTEKPVLNVRENESTTAEKPRMATRPAEGEQAEQTEKFLRGLLQNMDVEAEMEITIREDGDLNVNLSGPGIGAVIGRRGETLDAIQHLTNYAVNRGSDKHAHINVDAEDYRAKREDSLVRLAQKMAAKAIKYRRSMALEPMNSYERHIIHTALQDYEGVSTSSTGTEPNRRVVVSYVKPDPTKKKDTDYKEWC